MTLSRPLPILITIAASTTHEAFAISGPIEIEHRWGKISLLGTNEGLISAAIQALRAITAARASKYAKVHADYVASLNVTTDSGIPAPNVQPLPVMMRSDSRELIEAATYIAGLDGASLSEGILRDLCEQVHRPDIAIHWVLLPKRAAEIEALERWITVHCRPGQAVVCEGASRSSYRATSESFENTDMDSDASDGYEDTDEQLEIEELAA